MAREINLSFEGKQYKFGIEKLDRKKVYGYTVIDVKDENGSNCGLASISDDGQHVLPKGCVGYTTLNDRNEYVSSADIQRVDSEGILLEKIPSSFDLEKIDLKITSLEAFFQLHVKSIYQLSSSSEDDELRELITLLTEHKVLKFTFNYRTDYNSDDAFLLHNDEGIFMAIGSVSPYEFVGLDKVIEELVVETDDDDDDFDFGML